MKITYTPVNVCSREMEIELNDNHIITGLDIVGGCAGNLQGIRTLVLGMRAEDVIEKLRGIRCKTNTTSCPDQLAKALSEAISAEGQG